MIFWSWVALASALIDFQRPVGRPFQPPPEQFQRLRVGVSPLPQNLVQPELPLLPVPLPPVRAVPRPLLPLVF